MKTNTILFTAVANFLITASAIAATPADYQACLSSLRNDADIMTADLSDDSGRIVYHKKSLYDRDLFLVSAKKIYSCGELSVQSSTSNTDVLNFDFLLTVNNKSYPIRAEIPTVLTFGAEDLVLRELINQTPSEVLKCNEAEPSEFDMAFSETVGARFKGFVIEFRGSVANKKSEELNKVWGESWKAKPAIDSERNKYLKVLKSCEKISGLTQLRTSVKAELISIK